MTPAYFQEFGGKPAPRDAPTAEVESFKALLGVPGGEQAAAVSVQLEISDRSPGVRRLYRLLHRLLEFLLQQLRGMLLRFHRLPEDRIPTAVLLLHGASRLFHIVEGFWLDRCGVSDDAARRTVDFHERAAAGASHVKIRSTKIGFALRHTAIIPQSGSAWREANRQNVEHIQQLPTQQDDRHQHH